MSDRLALARLQLKLRSICLRLDTTAPEAQRLQDLAAAIIGEVELRKSRPLDEARDGELLRRGEELVEAWKVWTVGRTRHSG